ncbi:MAG: hypothetical protein R3C16_11390 [Hyphomonadaceae bacterium]
MLPMLAIVYTVFTHALTGASVAQMNAAVGPYVLVLWAINLFFFINLGCLGGTNGPNKYGDPPGSGGAALVRAAHRRRKPAAASPFPA